MTDKKLELTREESQFDYGVFVFGTLVEMECKIHDKENEQDIEFRNEINEAYGYVSKLLTKYKLLKLETSSYGDLYDLNRKQSQELLRLNEYFNVALEFLSKNDSCPVPNNVIDKCNSDCKHCIYNYIKQLVEDKHNGNKQEQ